MHVLFLTMKMILCFRGENLVFCKGKQRTSQSNCESVESIEKIGGIMSDTLNFSSSQTFERF